jgi:ethanolamine ammonia-lyase small subunit
LILLAGEPGFEPGLTESESVGLPLTYSPKKLAALAGAGRHIVEFHRYANP